MEESKRLINENTEDKGRAFMQALGEQEGHDYQIMLFVGWDPIAERHTVMTLHKNPEKKTISPPQVTALMQAVGDWFQWVQKSFQKFPPSV